MLMFLHMALFCAPLKIKYHIYVYLVFKFIINEVVSLKKFGPVHHWGLGVRYKAEQP